jgi:DNA polymerase II small subunit/DNA polymerase delta subunit B
MYRELWGDYEDVLVSDLVLCTENKRDENQRVYLMKGSIYMTMPNYMTMSGNTEYLEITHGSNFNDLVSELAKLKHRISYDALHGLLSRTLIYTACDTCLDL